MKKLLLTILLLALSCPAFCIYSWPADVFTALLMENNVTDDSGKLTWVDYQTCHFSNTIFKYDSYSLGSLATDESIYITTLAPYTLKTVDVWFYIDSANLPNGDYVFSIISSDSRLYFYSGQMQWYMGGIGVIATTVSYNTWHRFQAEFTGTYCKIYYDGIYTNQLAYTGYPASANLVSVGNHAGWTNGWTGYIDNFILSNINTYNGAEITPIPNVTDTFTPTFTPTPTLSPTVCPMVWTELTASASWTKRCFPRMITYKNNLWLIGGANTPFLTTIEYNDVWRSTNGVDWTLVTGNANFLGRHRHTCLVYDNKMWVIGGQYLGNSLKDVWWSTDGANWTQATANAGFGARSSHESVVWNNQMLVISGQIQGIGPVNDVWSSTDGATWTGLTLNAQFPALSGFTSTVMGNEIFITSGDSTVPITNDVWGSTNGTFWTNLATLDGDENEHMFMFTLDNRIWAGGGNNIHGDVPAYANLRASYDGITWYTEGNGFGPHEASAVSVMNNEVYLAGGTAGDNHPTPTVLNDVWKGTLCNLQPSKTMIYFDESKKVFIDEKKKIFVDEKKKIFIDEKKKIFKGDK
jgi:hypothetical protein